MLTERVLEQWLWIMIIWQAQSKYPPRAVTLASVVLLCETQLPSLIHHAQ